ncbi:fimbria/pilus periplasmic chaperone [Vibrio owensii]|uniref:fimbrial biogenesis chaperone n=1 Tax=Vibrio owensii TaxID=696485 RepID=UPI0018F23E30|nr:fimbria/pilus periplasmic chaperone [Vibrio owensii]
MKTLRLLFLILIYMPAQALAFELFPMVQFLSDSGKEATVFFKVTNTSLTPLPIEVTGVKRHVEFNNEEELVDTDELMIFPPQVLIQPGKSQTVKVQYTGAPKSVAESYRLIVSQLPLKASDVEQDTIQMLFRIGALIFVSPQSAQEQYTSKIILSNKKPNLQIRNTGSSVIELNKHNYSVSWQGETKRWNWEQLEPVLPMQYLIPNQQVQVSVESLLVN